MRLGFITFALLISFSGNAFPADPAPNLLEVKNKIWNSVHSNLTEPWVDGDPQLKLRVLDHLHAYMDERIESSGLTLTELQTIPDIFRWANIESEEDVTHSGAVNQGDGSLSLTSGTLKAPYIAFTIAHEFEHIIQSILLKRKGALAQEFAMGFQFHFLLFTYEFPAFEAEYRFLKRISMDRNLFNQLGALTKLATPSDKAIVNAMRAVINSNAGFDKKKKAKNLFKEQYLDAFPKVLYFRLGENLERVRNASLTQYQMHRYKNYGTVASKCIKSFFKLKNLISNQFCNTLMSASKT